MGMLLKPQTTLILDAQNPLKTLTLVMYASSAAM